MEQDNFYVDDDEENLIAFKSDFRREFDAYIRDSVSDGLRFVSDHEIYLILEDQSMLEISGVDFFKHSIESVHNTLKHAIIRSGNTINARTINAQNRCGFECVVFSLWYEESLSKRVKFFTKKFVN